MNQAARLSGADTPAVASSRVTVDGKFLARRGQRFLLKGVTYGTFAPDADGRQFPPLETVRRDFAAMAAAGVNTVRVYTPPTRTMADAAAEHDLVLMVGVPWTQHVAFLDERMSAAIRRDVVAAVRQLADHPAVGLFALGNEIPPSVIRWQGAARVEAFLRTLADDVRAVAPDTPLAYVNFPPTEFLDLSAFDVCAFNVYLHREKDLRAYLARLQLIAGNKPFVLAEAGADSIREGADGQAAITAMHVRAAFEAGSAGAVAFAWTDEWWRGGSDVTDWAFGLVDVARRPKPALEAVSQAFADAPFPAAVQATWPRVSVVVCAYNAGDTIGECLDSLGRLTYPNAEVVVVNDGSTDRTGEIAHGYPFARVIDIPNGGLSAARNVGWQAASGEIVAYTDADVRVDPDWLTYLVQPFLRSDVVASGGPNVVPADDPFISQAVARSPGGPTHVLLDDVTAEHVPGCNMAFRREALAAIGGFNPIYLRAGDDVDVCWRLQARGWRIGFAPSALVWHRHRSTVKAYWKQQLGYGEGEAWLMHQHPDKFAGGDMIWHGRIYSPLPFVRALTRMRVNTGSWGLAPFPSVYFTGANPWSHLPHSGGWQLLSVLHLAAGLVAFALGLPLEASLLLLGAGLAGIGVTVGRCIRYAAHADVSGTAALPGRSLRASRLRLRAMIGLLHLLQPLARIRGRIRGTFTPPQLPHGSRTIPASVARPTPRVSDGWTAVRLLAGRGCEQRFWGERWTSVDAVLSRLIEALRLARVSHRIDIDDGWTGRRDLSVALGPWANLDLDALVEEHAQGRVLVRMRTTLRPTLFGGTTALLAFLAIVTASSTGAFVRWPIASLAVLSVAVGLLFFILWRTASAHAGVARVVAHVLDGLEAQPIGRRVGGALRGPGRSFVGRIARPALAGGVLLGVVLGSASIARDSWEYAQRAMPVPVPIVAKRTTAPVPFRTPRLALALAPNGDLYLADGEHDLIRRVTAQPAVAPVRLGTATTAGTRTDVRPTDPPVRFDTPGGVAFAPNGDLLVVDAQNHRVCRIDRLTRAVTVVAGTGKPGFVGDGGPARLAQLSMPSAIAIAPNGDLFVADTGNHRVRRIVAAKGIITTVAGGGTADADGPGTVGDGHLATQAVLAWPADVAVAPSGDLYIADTEHNRVRRVDARTGTITTVAGDGTAGYRGDGGPALLSRLSAPTGLALMPHGRRLTIYIADSANGRIRVIEPDGRIETLSSPDNRRLGTPARLAAHPKGWLYVADAHGDQVTTLSLAPPAPRTLAPPRRLVQRRVM